MMNEKQLRSALDALIEDYIGMYGVLHAIAYLLNLGFTDEELIELKFNVGDIKTARNSLDEAGVILDDYEYGFN